MATYEEIKHLFELDITLTSPVNEVFPIQTVVIPITEKTTIHGIVYPFINFLNKAAGISENLIMKYLKSFGTRFDDDSCLEELFVSIDEDQDQDTKSSYHDFIYKLKDPKFRRYVKKLYDEDMGLV